MQAQRRAQGRVRRWEKRERLAAFKYPRRVTLLPALPRSATGKVLKAALARAAD